MDDPGERSRGIEAMNPLRVRLEEARKRMGLPWEVLERDYLLSWILAGITQLEILQNSLVFKGGTALKKCYFGDYRFSEDLDFTGGGSVPIHPGGVTLPFEMLMDGVDSHGKDVPALALLNRRRRTPDPICSSQLARI
jgi:hypothetical protein